MILGFHNTHSAVLLFCPRGCKSMAWEIQDRELVRGEALSVPTFLKSMAQACFSSVLNCLIQVPDFPGSSQLT